MFVSREWVEEVRSRLPELPDARRARYVSEHGLDPYLAGQLTASKDVSDLFERAIRLYPNPRKVGNWIQTEVFRLQKDSGDDQGAGAMPAAEHLVTLLQMIDRGTVSVSAAKQVFEEVYRTGQPPEAIVEARGFTQVSDAESLEGVVLTVIEANPQPVADYLSGKTAALGRLVGEVMKATRGRANPAVVNDLLRKKLDEGPKTNENGPTNQ